MIPGEKKSFGHVFIGSFILAIICLGFGANQRIYAQKDDWKEYKNYDLGISFEYPIAWDFKKPEGGNTKNHDFTLTDSSEKIAVGRSEYSIKIEMGHYNTPIDDSESLEEWTENYERSFPFGETTKIKIIKNDKVKIAGVEGLRRNIITSEGNLEYVNIRHGNEVWYIWTNGLAKRQPIFESTAVQNNLKTS